MKTSGSRHGHAAQGRIREPADAERGCWGSPLPVSPSRQQSADGRQRRVPREDGLPQPLAATSRIGVAAPVGPSSPFRSTTRLTSE
jgi:hypothetical protein